MPTPFLHIDAFSAKPFGGNPAAVCLLGRDAVPDTRRLQAVAMEMNLSETAFVTPRGDEGFGLRWFTPTIEVDLCGHATLASAAAVWEWGLRDQDAEIVFQTRSGPLRCSRDGDLIALDLPSSPPRPADATISRAVGALLDRPVEYVGRSPLNYLMAVVRSESDVASIAPDLGALKDLPFVGLIVTAASDDARFDFVSRFFAPSAGVDEDPVCGSAHCVLGPYWADRIGKQDLMAHQISARRGVVRVRLTGDRVELAGRACVVVQGDVRVVLDG